MKCFHFERFLNTECRRCLGFAELSFLFEAKWNRKNKIPALDFQGIR